MLGTPVAPPAAAPSPNKTLTGIPLPAPILPPKNPSVVRKPPTTKTKNGRPLLVATAVILPALAIAGAVIYGNISLKQRQQRSDEAEQLVAEAGSTTTRKKSGGTDSKATVHPEKEKAELEPKEVPGPKLEPKTDPRAEPKPETKGEPKPQPKVEPKREPEPEPKPRPQPKLDRKAEVEAQVKNLKDKDPIVRLKAVRELEKLGPAAKEALPALEEATKDEDEGGPGRRPASDSGNRQNDC